MADDFTDFEYDDDEDYGYDDADTVESTDIDQVPDDGNEDDEVRNNSPFYKAAGLLVFIFLIALLCGGVSFATRGSGGDGTDSASDENSEQSEEIAVIETQNAIIAVENAAVTQTIVAMETEAATTPTPAIPATNTPMLEPTKTSVPTATPLFQETTPDPDGDGSSDGDGNGSDGSGSDGSSSSTGDGVSTPTPIPGLGGGSSSDGGSGTLPETGIGAWVAALAALGLISLFMGARKMRLA